MLSLVFLLDTPTGPGPDETFPIILVPEGDLSGHVDVADRPQYLYLLRIQRWDARSQFPVGTFVMFLGKVHSWDWE